MRKIRVCGFLACMTLVFFLLSVPSAMAGPDEEVLKVITTFVKAINDNDSDTLSGLWYQDPKTTSFGPWGRFLAHEWLTAPPPGVGFAVNYPEVTMLGDNTAVITGYFTVTTAPTETTAMKTEYLRETMVVQKIQKKWLIVHEHCSYQP